MNYPDIALQVPEVIIPSAEVALDRWAVIACDQYTSEPEYWERVHGDVGDAPSALNLVLPEAHLERPDRNERIAGIGRRMEAFLDDGVLQQLEPGFVLIDRQTPRAASRKGLLVALDLDRYDYGRNSRSLIRPTEGTVVSRLPPRIEIRRGALLELPHVMVLIDDPERTVIEPLFAGVEQPLYDVELMQGGGHVRGWLVSDRSTQDRVAQSLRRLLPTAAGDAMLYALGDGNHSVAAAKEVWEETGRSAPERGGDHPARHVLVELVNVHDEGMTLEPIHRLLTGGEPADLLERLVRYHQERGVNLHVAVPGDRPAGEREAELPFLAGRRMGALRLSTGGDGLQVVALAGIVDAFCDANADLTLDYIHGADVLQTLASRPGNLGFAATTIDKHQLFPTIRSGGPLPRKSFSMGEAEEKRYYLEARRIR